MITFRKADILEEGEEIASLLRDTFDQSIFTVEYLVWKHVDNPAGKSFVLVAEENSRIVGLRIFMLWDFNINGKHYKALRPVDTAVHKDYQGKGLFKQLTLKGLEMMQGNFDFIFNTPNKNSLPGYLKMGWTQIDSSPVFYFTPVLPFLSWSSFKVNRNLEKVGPVADFIQWRYNPQRYKWATFNDKSIIIYRVEKRKFYNLVIFVDSFFAGDNLNARIRSICRREKSIGFMFLYSAKTKSLKSVFSMKRGAPVIVSKDADAILNPYPFALGDVEGIL